MAFLPEIGDRVQILATFKNDAGDPADPTTVTVKVLRPRGQSSTHTTPEITSSGTGLFAFSWIIDQAGLWSYRWQGAGVIDQAEERRFTVRPSAF